MLDNSKVNLWKIDKKLSKIDIIEERKDDPELPKGKEEVQSEGEQGETTVTKTYEVNPETGELTNPVEKTETTKAMRQKVILVGTNENKPSLLSVSKDLENAVNVTKATAEMKNVDLLTNEKLSARIQLKVTKVTNVFERKEIKKWMQLKLIR